MWRIESIDANRRDAALGKPPQGHRAHRPQPDDDDVSVLNHLEAMVPRGQPDRRPSTAMAGTQPPIDVSVPAAQAQARLDASRIELGDATAQRLREACANVATEPEAIVEASRDWWPIALRWARAGLVPALPHAVARPSSTAEVVDVVRICNEDRVPLTAAGGRSGVCGGAVPLHGGVA